MSIKRALLLSLVFSAIVMMGMTPSRSFASTTTSAPVMVLKQCNSSGAIINNAPITGVYLPLKPDASGNYCAESFDVTIFSESSLVKELDNFSTTQLKISLGAATNYTYNAMSPVIYQIEYHGNYYMSAQNTSVGENWQGSGLFFEVVPKAGTATINGTLLVGDTLTAVSDSASGSVSYQWLECATSVGTYAPINGATASTYTLASSDVGHYIEVAITVAGSSFGAATSAAVGPVTTATAVSHGGGGGGGNSEPLLYKVNLATSPTSAYGTASGGGSFAAGTPETVTATPNSGYSFVDWTEGGTAVSTSSSYSFSMPSSSVSLVANFVVAATTPITALTAITGTPQVGSILTAGALTPVAATVAYQWQESSTPGGAYTDISGATSNTYLIAAAYSGDYIEVVATGTGNYTGTATSTPVSVTAATTPITALAAITGTPQVGSILTAGALTPVAATVAYQWQESSTPGGAYTDISGATSNTYTPTITDLGQYIEVVATGTGNYSGSATSGVVGPITTPLTSVTISAYVYEETTVILTTGLIPANATACYQWLDSPYGDGTGDGTYTPISGATSRSYAPPYAVMTECIEVQATGTGSYTGTVTSAPLVPSF
jgi:hypothetical protein